MQTKNLETEMINKKYLIIGIIVLVVIIIAVLGFYFFGEKNLCKKIDANNQELLNECNLCEKAYDPIDCKDGVYRNYAMSKKEASLCKNIIRDYNRDDCVKSVERTNKIGEPDAESIK